MAILFSKKVNRYKILFINSQNTKILLTSRDNALVSDAKHAAVINTRFLSRAYKVSDADIETAIRGLISAANEIAYTRQAGLSSLQNEQMILAYVGHHHKIRRRDVMDLCHINKDQTTRLLKKLTDEGKLQKQGQSRGTYYVLLD